MKQLNKCLLTLVLLSASCIVFADSSMTVSQKVIFEGFTGAKFTYITPSSDQIACGDGDVKSKSYSLPHSIPPRDPFGNSADVFQLKFTYDVPWYADATCGVGQTTSIKWKTADGVDHACAFTVILGGGASNTSFSVRTGKKHMCSIGIESNGVLKANECYSYDCNSKDDSSKDLWIVHPKNKS